jgi:hypothetical protein
MRKDEDDIRHFMPVLRRIIILVAVLTAVPVVLWTITAFVRTYVGPPKLPTFQPMTTSREAPDSAAPVPDTRSPSAPALQKADAAPLPAVVEARATTTDARSPVLEIIKLPAAEQPSDIDVNAPSGDAKTAGATVALSTAAAPAAADTAADVAAPTAADTAADVAAPAAADTAADVAAPTAADTAANVAAPSPVAHPAPSPAPNPAPNSAMQIVDQEPPAANWPAVEPLPPADPIAGPVPLPRQRPRLFALAQTGVPLPQPRPASAPQETPSEPTPSYQTDDRLLVH